VNLSTELVEHGQHLTCVGASETFEGTWPFRALFTHEPGFKMHYVDEGVGKETLLLLHGEPTWGYLFRNLIPVWAQYSRVVVPDHMGFGKSATPADRTYWLQDHVDNLEKLVIALDLNAITLVMHDFGGPMGMGLAARQPDRIKRVVSINAPVPFGHSDLKERLSANAKVSPWFQWILDAENKGILEQVLGHLDYNMLSTLKLNGFLNSEIITDTWIRAYSAPFPSSEYAKGAIGWAKGIAIGAHQFERPSAETIAKIQTLPALCIWGAEDRTLNSDYFVPLFMQLFANAPVHRLPNASHYSPEDAPEKIANLVLAFLNSSA